MISSYKEWYLYNHEANTKYIEALNKIKSPVPQTISIFSHILVAHRIWLNRLRNLKDSYRPWDLLDPEQFSAVNEKNLDDTVLLLETGANDAFVSNKVIYTNSQGQSFQNTAGDILTHVLMHSAYHRGQLALLLRQNDIAPPMTDYIFFKREMDSRL